MELIYNNKSNEQEILLKAKQVKCNMEISDNKSMLFKGDNFKALSILLEKYTGKIDLVYIDPPYNTYNNFFVSENRANSVSNKQNGVIAYCDKMSKDEYLEFLRERLLLLRTLMSDRGSIYLHIDCKIGHYVKIIMDEIFGGDNFKNDITRIKSNPKNFYRKAYGNEKDLILFYAKKYNNNIWNDVRIPLAENEVAKKFPKIDQNGRRYTTIPLHAPGETKNGVTGKPWRDIPVPEGRHWRTDPAEFDKLDAAGKIEWSATGNPRLRKYANEHKGKKIQDVWTFKDLQVPSYPTEKNGEMIKQIILQSSEQNSIVLDCFAGSGSTLKIADSLGRRWIGVDNSDVAINIIRKSELGNYVYYDMEENFCESIENTLF